MKRKVKAHLAGAGLTLMLAGLASAQGDRDPGLDVASVAASARGLWDGPAGEFRAGGPNYAATFDRGGVQFTPALGRIAPRDMPLRYTLVSIHRGGTAVLGPQAGRAQRAGEYRVVRRRAPSIVERFDVRAEGVEVSYVFERRLPGRGALVVRARIETELRAERVGDSSDGLRFSQTVDGTVDGTDIGGVAIGAVTGIDGRGRVARGSLRFDGTFVELELPAEFVDGATYPLVLDPLIGTDITVGSGFDDRDADVAFDVSTNRYCFVWSRVFSAQNVALRAQRVDASGNLFGTLMLLSSGAGYRLNPAIANVNQSDRFLVAWQEGPSFLGPFDIRARAINTNGTTSSVIDIAATPANEVDPDVGNESATVDDDALVVWSDQSGIKIAEVAVPPVGDPSLTTTPQIVTTVPSAAKPAISKGGGSSGRHAVVFQRLRNGSLDLVARLVDRHGTPIGLPVFMAANATVDELEPDVDGDGDRFVLVYARAESPTSNKRDIWCRPMHYDTDLQRIAAAGPPVAVASTPDVDETDPAIGHARHKYMVAWAREAGFLQYDIGAKTIDRDSCAACGRELLIRGSRPYNAQPAIATHFSSGGIADHGMIAFASSASQPPFSGELHGQLFEAIGRGGSKLNLGGGCGSAGTITIAGFAAIGNRNLRIQLTGATATAAALNVGIPGPPLACGTCQVLLGFASFPAALTNGSASMPLPVPCDPGLENATLELQWLTIGGFATPCRLVPTLGASDRMSMTLGY